MMAFLRALRNIVDVLGSALFFIYFCEFWLFYTQRFFYILYVFKGAKLAKFIRCEAAGKLMWDTRCELKGASISITKFTENRWNDCVFERTEEHRRCCGKCTSFSVYTCRKEHILLIKRFFTLLRYVQNDRVLVCIHRLENRAIGMRCELRGKSISITKFTKYRWNDVVFEDTEEHRRCSGNFL